MKRQQAFRAMRQLETRGFQESNQDFLDGSLSNQGGERSALATKKFVEFLRESELPDFPRKALNGFRFSLDEGPEHACGRAGGRNEVKESPLPCGFFLEAQHIPPVFFEKNLDPVAASGRANQSPRKRRT